LKIAEGLGGPLNGLYECCLTVVIHRGIDDKDEKNEPKS
jgi:hypothetical protein